MWRSSAHLANACSLRTCQGHTAECSTPRRTAGGTQSNPEDESGWCAEGRLGISALRHECRCKVPVVPCERRMQRSIARLCKVSNRRIGRFCIAHRPRRRESCISQHPRIIAGIRPEQAHTPHSRGLHHHILLSGHSGLLDKDATMAHKHKHHHASGHPAPGPHHEVGSQSHSIQASVPADSPRDTLGMQFHRWLPSASWRTAMGTRTLGKCECA
mmetsp:Transcript_56929/g.99529  ORF Transcript_56929/g.99529 Transcript_56929/m.99529 type:complete len:215 (+) Transcript_56929:232-876(+)